MSRATSTVADVTVFLLLVGAAITVVVNGATVEQPRTENPAAERTELLATSTASVEYALRVPVDTPRWISNATATHQRTAHGTLAELLAEAAMSRVGWKGYRLSRAGAKFERSVTTITRTRLRERGLRTAVRVQWDAYRDAPLTATLEVGDRPPPSADVDAATTTVPSPAPSVNKRAKLAASQGGYKAVATVVASAVVQGLFPPRQAQLALDGDYPADRLMSRRYRRMGALTRADQLSVKSTAAADLNRRLTTALTARFEHDMRSRFRSPEAAADAVRTGSVSITVRTWEP